LASLAEVGQQTSIVVLAAEGQSTVTWSLTAISGIAALEQLGGGHSKESRLTMASPMVRFCEGTTEVGKARGPSLEMRLV
jgi:hypothetical protein